MSGGGVALAGVPPPAAQGAASQSHWALGPPQRTQRESFLTPNETCSSPSRGLHHAPDADPVSEGLTLLSTHPTLLLQPGTPSAKQVTHFPPSAPSPHLPTCGEGGDLASQRCQDGRKCRGKAGSDTTPRSLPAALPGPGRHSASTPPVQHLVSRLPDSALASSLPLRPPPHPCLSFNTQLRVWLFTTAFSLLLSPPLLPHNHFNGIGVTKREIEVVRDVSEKRGRQRLSEKGEGAEVEKEIP